MQNEKVKLVWITPNAQEQVMYCARVSNPANQNSSNTKILDYCIKNSHWSIFEMANMCLEITTSRAISAQILRHRSFSFQEFSQRYAKTQSVEMYEPRRQDEKNRQNSIDDLSQEDKIWFENASKDLINKSQEIYEEALSRGIAKECARFLLPMSSTTKLYMNGTLRSWMHYINLRSGNGTQLEHRDIAKQAKLIFKKELPVLANSLGW